MTYLCTHSWIAPSAIWLLCAAFHSPVSAQAIAPALDGTNTQVNQTGNTFTIQGGSLSRDGANLFHSFQRFGLSAEQIANFLATPATRNILNRIVGGDPSVIDGLLRVSGGNANLYLINPAGIIFGPNSRLDVPGDFMATTATRVGFGGDRWFNAFSQNDYASLVGTPSFFMFDAIQSGSIINAGQLSVKEGKNLTLLSGSLVSTGQLNAPNGSINVATVPGTGRVRISQLGHLLSLEIEVPTNADRQPIPFRALDLPRLLTGGAAVNLGVTVTSDNQVQLANSAIALPVAPGTTVLSGQLSVAGQQLSLLHGQNPLPQINLLGDRVALLNANLDASGNNGGTIRVGGDYQGKGTVPNAQHTLISQDSTLQADGLGTGNGGRIIVWADQTTRFSGSIRAKGGEQAGHGGFVEVSGRQQLAVSGQVDLSAPQGLTGTVLFDPLDIRIVAGVGSDDAQLADSSIFAGDGAAATFVIGAATLAAIQGDIQLQASRNIILDTDLTLSPTVNATFLNPNASFSLVANGAILGNGNNIRARARNVSLTAARIENLGEIRTNTAPDLPTDPELPNANGGNITLTATNGGIQTRLLRSSSDFLNTTNLIDGRRGGNITLNATGDIVVTGDRQNGSIKTGEYAPSGTVSLTSTGGNITLVGFASASNFLQPSTITIEAAGNFTVTEGALSIDYRDPLTPLAGLTVPPPTPTSISVRAGGSINLERINGNRNNQQGLPSNQGLVRLEAGETIQIGSLRNEGYPTQLISRNGTVNVGPVNAETRTTTGRGGDFEVQARQGITTGLINASGQGGAGGTVALTSETAAVTTGNINTTGTSGGNLTIDAPAGITTGAINTSGDPGNGGNVSLETRNGITLASINTQSNQGRGGDIEVEIVNTGGGREGQGGNLNAGTNQFFRVTGTFEASNGVIASISTAGGQGGGTIRIEQGNTDPFGVGDLSQRNGTAGAITTGDTTILPVQVFRNSYNQGGINIIKLSTSPPQLSPRSSPSPLPPLPERCFPYCQLPSSNLVDPDKSLDSTVEDAEEQFTREFENYLGIKGTRIKTLSQVQAELRQAEQATGRKTALIYAYFKNKNSIWEFLKDTDQKERGLQKTKQQDGDQLSDILEAEDTLTLLMVTSQGAILQNGKPLRARSLPRPLIDKSDGAALTLVSQQVPTYADFLLALSTLKGDLQTLEPLSLNEQEKLREGYNADLLKTSLFPVWVNDNMPVWLEKSRRWEQEQDRIAVTHEEVSGIPDSSLGVAGTKIMQIITICTKNPTSCQDSCFTTI
jgi:filamentous hemagglutinin family protein